MHDATQFLELADELAKRSIELARFDTSSSFDFVRCIGEIPPAVGMIRTEYEMRLETGREGALVDLITAWPFECMGYTDPGVDLEFPPMNVTLERQPGGAIGLVHYSITLTGTCFKR
jgi:hypothetical protein